MNFHTSVFKNSKIVNVARYGEAGANVSGMPQGTVMTVTSEIERQEFVALNGGPVFTFSPAISFVVNCETQHEIDELWNKLTEGGEEVQSEVRSNPALQPADIFAMLGLCLRG